MIMYCCNGNHDRSLNVMMFIINIVLYNYFTYNAACSINMAQTPDFFSRNFEKYIILP